MHMCPVTLPNAVSVSRTWIEQVIVVGASADLQEVAPVHVPFLQLHYRTQHNFLPLSSGCRPSHPKQPVRRHVTVNVCLRAHTL
jgi:hypothetical protein